MPSRGRITAWSSIQNAIKASGNNQSIILFQRARAASEQQSQSRAETDGGDRIAGDASSRPDGNPQAVICQADERPNQRPQKLAR